MAKALETKGDTLVTKVKKLVDFVTRLQKEDSGNKFPTVSISVPERHIGALTIDPAVQTELAFILRKLGATLLGSKESVRVEVEILREAFSEFGLGKGTG